MAFREMAACCAGMAAIVRDTGFPPAVIIPFSAKKYIIRRPSMIFPEVAACGTG